MQVPKHGDSTSVVRETMPPAHVALRLRPDTPSRREQVAPVLVSRHIASVTQRGRADEARLQEGMQGATTHSPTSWFGVKVIGAGFGDKPFPHLNTAAEMRRMIVVLSVAALTLLGIAVFAQLRKGLSATRLSGASCARQGGL